MKQRFLLVAGIVVIGGLLWNGGAWLSQDGSTSTDTGEGSAVSLRSELVERSAGGSEAPAPEDGSWGDAAVRLGFCFIVAMIVGMLFRSFVKTMFLVAVVVVGGLWFLEDRGMIDPFWHQYMGSWEAAREWVASQTDSVKALLKGSLPSVGAALLGFAFGLRK